MPGLIAINGQVSRAEDARISPFDRGFLYGDAVFEGMVAFGGRILDLDAHLARLFESAAKIRIELPWSLELLRNEVQDLASQLNAPKGHLRLVVTRGEGMWLGYKPEMHPNRILFALPAPASQAHHKGVRLRSTPTHGTCRGSAPKTCNYLDGILALADAKDHGDEDVVWINADGEVTEATTANIFLKWGTELVTPSAESGLLRGITRGRVISSLARRGLTVAERIVLTDELRKCDEAFLTSTVRGVVPVTSIDNRPLESTTEGALFHTISAYFMEDVKNDLGFSFDWGSGEVT